MSYSNKNHREALSKSIRNNKLSHAYLIYGGDDGSRRKYTENIVKEIFCLQGDNPPCGVCGNCLKVERNNMEDIIYVEKDGNSIKVDQIKALGVALSNKPFTTRTVAVINNADTMTQESQNKLLKNLEEPGGGTVLILSAANLFALYPTVRSRCIIINMGGLNVDWGRELSERAANIVKYSMINKPLHTVFREVKECVDSVSEAEKLVNALEAFVRDVLVGRYSKELLFNERNLEIVERIDWNKGYPFKEYLKYIETAKIDLKRNINWKYTMKNLIINFKQEELHG